MAIYRKRTKHIWDMGREEDLEAGQKGRYVMEGVTCWFLIQTHCMTVGYLPAYTQNIFRTIIPKLPSCSL